MAKINIDFNDKKYSIDESSLSVSADSLKSHLSTVMKGTGATINFGGTAYGVDSTKLSTATNAFVSHLGTIAGNGKKIVIGGVEYSVGSDKVAVAIGELEAVLGGLNSGSDSGETYAAGLYQTGAIDLYNEQGADAIEGMVIKSWDELIAENIIRVDNGTLYTNCDKVAGANGSSDLLVGDLILPEDGSIVILGDAAFGHCNNLSGITLPDSVNQINAMAFYRCLNLSKILFANTTGWYVARSSTAASGITIPSADLMDASTAAATMKNYSGLHWLRSDK